METVGSEVAESPSVYKCDEGLGVPEARRLEW